MPLVFFTFSRVLRRAWSLDLTDKSPLVFPIVYHLSEVNQVRPPLDPLWTPSGLPHRVPRVQGQPGPPPSGPPLDPLWTPGHT
eukprot:850598-Prorocentrum_minimum.AAC.1